MQDKFPGQKTQKQMRYYPAKSKYFSRSIWWGTARIWKYRHWQWKCFQVQLVKFITP